MASFTLLGEAKFQRRTLSVPPSAAVAAATRELDWIPLLKAPSDHGIVIKSCKFEAGLTKAAGATNYFDLQLYKVRGATATALGSVLVSTNTGFGWTAFVPIEMVKKIDGHRLNANERLFLRIDHVGTGAAHEGYGLHLETEIV